MGSKVELPRVYILRLQVRVNDPTTLEIHTEATSLIFLGIMRLDTASNDPTTLEIHPFSWDYMGNFDCMPAASAIK